MNTTRTHTTDTPTAALDARASSVRLRAALAIGTARDAAAVPALVARCAVEPDFFVRDMLTWALCRMPATSTVAPLVAELLSEVEQARSQALHTLSKIGDPSAWPAVSALVHDPHDEVALTAWRTAAALAPAGAEADLATEIVAEFGRGDLRVRRGASRVLVGLGDAARPALDAALGSRDPGVRAHAEATERLRRDPDGEFEESLAVARRVSVTGADA